MVKIIIILLCLLYSTAYSIDTCFTKQEIINISKHISKIEQQNKISDTIIIEQDIQIRKLNKVIEIDSNLIENYKIQLGYFLKNEDYYKQVIAELEPKWYEDPKLWFIGGLISGFLISR